MTAADSPHVAPRPVEGEADRSELIATLRRLQDRLADASGSPDLDRWTAQALGKVLERHGPPPSSPGARSRDLSGSTIGLDQVLVPHFWVVESSPDAVRGTVRFTQAFTGRGAVHGGAIALLFDDVLGRLVDSRAVEARTAYLRVDFRNLTPVGEDLDFHGTVVSFTGRKLQMGIELSHRGTVLAQGEGLWIAPRAGLSTARA
ncbi:PaaI family thioesterase [Pseudonocardia sp. GCM10023141]|uniref:PaaI family thioesterase n=1 Tax=Pseudonocardia sp. GCM10023141 TaxID=3252653 RepID=UPI00360F54F3